LDIYYGKSQIRQTRELFSNNDGIQAHRVTQSYKPDEVTAVGANHEGVVFAKKLARNHEDADYTHGNTIYDHHHKGINYVNCETGNKYQAHGKEAIERAR